MRDTHQNRSGTDGAAASPALEQHYTVQQVAALWSMSAQTVRRMFADEPGVLKLSHPRIAGKGRPHVTLSIPASVLEWFHQQRSAGFGLEVQRRSRGI